MKQVYLPKHIVGDLRIGLIRVYEINFGVEEDELAGDGGPDELFDSGWHIDDCLYNELITIPRPGLAA